MLQEGLAGVQANSDAQRATARFGRSGEQMMSQLQARYYENTYRGKIYNAYATVTAPVIFSTAAGTGGPLLWNGSSTVNAVLLKIGYSTSVVSTVAGSLGITGQSGQVSAPTSTTAIDKGPVNNFIGGPAPLCSVYRVGTVTNAGNFFIPFAYEHTGSLTQTSNAVSWVDFEGCIVVPPQTWISVAASATLTTCQVAIAMVWAEVPV